MGAVSRTTNELLACATKWENAWNTATSSVHGERRSSKSKSISSVVMPGDLAATILSTYLWVSTLGSMRPTDKPGVSPSSVIAKWAAGSVVLR